MRRPSLVSDRRARLLWTAGLAIVLGATVTIATGRPAVAANCMDDVQRLTNQLGLAPSAPAHNGTTGEETPATTESRGISPEVTSRLTGRGAGAASGNPIAARRSEVLGMLQAARAASAQGNEQECLTQLNKAQNVMQER